MFRVGHQIVGTFHLSQIRRCKLFLVVQHISLMRLEFNMEKNVTNTLKYTLEKSKRTPILEVWILS